MTDIAWEGIPNWIVAGTSMLTLTAAVFAGVFAAKAAHWTKKQAEASDEQVRIAERSVAIAHEEVQLAKAVAEDQRREAEDTYRRYAESRLDILAPVVLATAKMTRSSGALQVHLQDSDGTWEFAGTVAEDLEEPREQGILYRLRLAIHFSNVSDKIARISIIDSASGEFEQHRQGRDIIVPPRDTKKFMWMRSWSPAMLATDEDVHDPKNWLFNLKFWVRDLGMNVCDTYIFNGDLRFFSRDGSRLLVKSEPEIPWNEEIAIPLPGRVYERLVADASSSHEEADRPA